jgi:hypothetical protein
MSYGYDGPSHTEWYWQALALLQVQQRAETAEAEAKRAAWQRRKLETRVQRLKEKVIRAGRVDWRTFKKIQTQVNMVARDR